MTIRTKSLALMAAASALAFATPQAALAHQHADHHANSGAEMTKASEA